MNLTAECVRFYVKYDNVVRLLLLHPFNGLFSGQPGKPVSEM